MNLININLKKNLINIIVKNIAIILIIFFIIGCDTNTKRVAPQQLIDEINYETDERYEDTKLDEKENQSNINNKTNNDKTDNKITDNRKYKSWTDISSGLPHNFKINSMIQEEGIFFASVANQGVYSYSNNSWKKITERADATYGIGTLTVDKEGFFYTLVNGEIYRLSQDRTIWGCLTCRESIDYYLIQMASDGIGYYFKAKDNNQFIFLKADDRTMNSFTSLNFPFDRDLKINELGSKLFYEDNNLIYISEEKIKYTYDGKIWKKQVLDECNYLKCIKTENFEIYINETNYFIIDSKYSNKIYNLPDLNSDLDFSIIRPDAIIIDNIIFYDNIIYLERTFDMIKIINIDEEYKNKNLISKIFAIEIDIDLLRKKS